jgi:hypothetical protein
MDNSNYYKSKYLKYKIKYLKEMYGGKLTCTCKFVNPETKVVINDSCVCEIQGLPSRKLDKKTEALINKKQKQIKILETELEKLKTDLEKLEDQ